MHVHQKVARRLSLSDQGAQASPSTDNLCRREGSFREELIHRAKEITNVLRLGPNIVQ